MPKSKHQIPGRVRSTYEFIKAHRDQYSVQTMCRVLEVAPSGYYDWLQQPISNRAQEDARLLRLIRASFVASHGIYGAPRVFLDLREAGETCSKHRVARLMRQANLRALHGYRIAALGRRQAVGPDPESPAATIHGHAAKHRLGDRHHLHPHVAGLALPGRRHGSVLAHDRRLGRQPTIHRELVLNAVLMAVRRRRPRGTLIHSDQGTQYGSDAWRRFCRSNHLEPSMSRKGNCWDNAVAESFFSSLKKERIKKQIYKNRELAIADVADYIDTFYNRTRRHSHLGGLSPEQFEAAHKPRRQRLH